MTHTLDLRLPNALINLSGDIPTDVRAALLDLTDPRLRLDLASAVASVHISTHDRGWHADFTSRTLGSRELTAGPEPQDLLDALVTRLNRISFDADPTRLHLHAGAVELDGSGILLAGASGSGKSTLVLEMLRRGAHYLTDENLTLAPGTRTVFAYPKPITLKSGSLQYLRDRAAGTGPDQAPPPTPARNGRAQLPASAIGATAPFARIDIIVFVQYLEHSATTLTPLSPAEACIRLLGDSLDTSRFGPGALEVVASMTNAASAWHLTHSDAADAADLIADIRPPLRTEMTVFHRSTGSEPEPPVKPAVGHESPDHSVRVVRFEDCAARYDGRSGMLQVLDENEATSWERGSEIELGSRGPLSPDAFALPGRSLRPPSDTQPLTQDQLRGLVSGRCTGVAVEQLARGWVPGTTAVGAMSWDAHVAGQATCTLLERELPRVVGLLEDVGADPLVMKGAVAAHDGLLPPHMRDFGDLDLLVPAERMNRAVAALTDAGFTRLFEQLSPDFDRRFAKSVTLQGRFSGTWPDGTSPTFEVDLHRTLTPGPFGAMVPLNELHDRSISARVNGRWYRTLHPEHRFLHGALHVVLGSPEPRLHTIRDLVLSAPSSPSAIEATLSTATRWRIDHVVSEALLLAESIAPRSIHQPLLSAFGKRPSRRLQKLLMASYHHPQMNYSLPALATMSVMPGISDRVDYAAAHIRHRRSKGADQTPVQ